jgi:hypothetical protein
MFSFIASLLMSSLLSLRSVASAISLALAGLSSFLPFACP